ncbi:hypothetical protein GJ496_010459 [Pomphorhynchus laevis]|nr:hypothetical protein GJ496_010459 [Pomphorhynchus laevis]
MPETILSIKQSHSNSVSLDKYDHFGGFALEVALYSMLLRRFHRRNPLCQKICSISYAGVGYAREVAGLECATHEQVRSMMVKPKFLSEIEAYACHLVYRFWVTQILENASKSCKEIKVVSHLNTCGNLDFCAFRIWIFCPKYELLCWNRFVVSISGSEIFIEKPDAISSMKKDIQAFKIYMELAIAAHYKSILISIANTVGFKACGQSLLVRSRSQFDKQDISFQNNEDSCHILLFVRSMSTSDLHVNVRVFCPSWRLSIVTNRLNESTTFPVYSKGNQLQSNHEDNKKVCTEVDLEKIPCNSNVEKFELVLSTLH